MLPEESLRKADIVTGVILFLISVGVIINALGMPMGGTYGGVENSWYVSPAAFPLAIGSLLMIASILLVLRAVKLGGLRNFAGYWSSQFTGFLNSNSNIRLLGIIGCLILYVLLLRLHLMIATCLFFRLLGASESTLFYFLSQPEGANYFFSSVIFLFVFTQIFYQPKDFFTGWKRQLLITGISITFPFFIGFIFSHYLRVPLP